MARIAIFCDGTWNSPRRARTTHVERLFEAAIQSTDQKTFYFPGVGTRGRFASSLASGLNMVGGGAFGWGLSDTIKQAYRALAQVYAAGDSIHIYGFSRGAYTARSLAGMIRKVGIVDDLSPKGIAEAFALYRLAGPENAPDMPHILKARQQLSPRFATSMEDVTWRRTNPDPRGIESDSEPVEIAYLGIWDTVGSLGIPSSILGPIAQLWNRKYQFHDTNLSRSVRAARHAVALDERRVFYRPALWNNLEQSLEGPGLNGGDRSATRPYQQVWFTGTHAVVGGSARALALTGLTLAWMAEGAEAAGLALDKSVLARHAKGDPLAGEVGALDPPLMYRLAGALTEWREGPGHRVDLHESVAARVAARAEYRPLSLRNLMPELFGGRPHGTKADVKQADGKRTR